MTRVIPFASALRPLLLLAVSALPAAAALLAAPVLAERAAAQEMRFHDLRFYRSDYRPTPKPQRRYVSLMPKSETSFVYWELTVANLLHNQRDQSHRVVAQWYGPGGAQIGRTEQTFALEAGWPSGWASHGWGFRQPGQWAPGEYRVDIHLDGRLFARRSFLVYDDAKVDPGAAALELTRLRLFESPYRPTPVDQRRYATRFARAGTRYIYAEIAARNLLYGQRAHRPIVLLRFYRPDGSFLGESILDTVVVQPNWRTALLWGGRGWPEPGRWQPGTYRVEVWFGDDNKVAETRFAIAARTAPDAAPDTKPDPGPDPGPDRTPNRVDPGDEQPREEEIRPEETPPRDTPPQTRRTPAPDTAPDTTPDRQPERRPGADDLPTLPGPAPDAAPKAPGTETPKTDRTEPAPDTSPSPEKAPAPDTPPAPGDPKSREVEELEKL